MCRRPCAGSPGWRCRAYSWRIVGRLAVIEEEISGRIIAERCVQLCPASAHCCWDEQPAGLGEKNEGGPGEEAETQTLEKQPCC